MSFFHGSHDADDRDQADEQPTTLPLISALSGADAGSVGAEFADADENRRVAMQSAILIAIVAVIAGGVLLTMRMLRADGVANAQNGSIAAIDNYLNKARNPELLKPDDPMHPDNLRGLFTDTQQIVRMIESSMAHRGMPVEDMAKNPFALPRSETAAAPDTQSAQRAREQLLTRLRGEFNRYDLQSIMGSQQRAVAVISGEFYRVGQPLGSFRVVSIEPTRVILAPVDLQRQPGDDPFVLSIQEPLPTRSVPRGL